MGNESDKLSQEEIDRLFETMQEDIGKSKVVIRKGNIYICIYCKHRFVLLNEWDSSFIFGCNKNNCRSEHGHTYISWEHLESLKKIINL